MPTYIKFHQHGCLSKAWTKVLLLSLFPRAESFPNICEGLNWTCKLFFYPLNLFRSLSWWLLQRDSFFLYLKSKAWLNLISSESKCSCFKIMMCTLSKKLIFSVCFRKYISSLITVNKYERLICLSDKLTLQVLPHRLHLGTIYFKGIVV